MEQYYDKRKISFKKSVPFKRNFEYHISTNTGEILFEVPLFLSFLTIILCLFFKFYTHINQQQQYELTQFKKKWDQLQK